MSKHLHGKDCQKCSEMLETAHPKIRDWFSTVVRPHFPEAHVSCAYRGKADQDAAFDAGKSKVRWPNSAHNAEQDGKPAARALDLFFLSQDGQHALFPLSWYKEIFATAVDHDDIPVRWGGNFKTLGDSNHFELA